MGIKIALAMPVYGGCSSRFLYALTKMITFTHNATIEWNGEIVRPEIVPLMISCSMLSESRNRLVVEAIAIDADYMLWLDADHVFPEDALLRLLSRSKLVVGCNYARRFDPTCPTAAEVSSVEGERENLLWTTEAKALAEECEEVAHLGMGLTLMDMRVFTILETRAKEQGKEHFWPLFHFEVQPNGIQCYGEDVYFFRKLKDAGIAAYCDHGLSWHVGHCFETILTNAHTIAQKDRWAAWNQTKFDHHKARYEEAIAAE